jgi:hypothetical protein
VGEWSSEGASCWSWWSIGGRSYELRRDRRGNYWDWRTHTKVAVHRPNQEHAVTWSDRTPEVYLHELVMGARADQEVYPANGNGLDCRKSNLRIRPRRDVIK